MDGYLTSTSFLSLGLTDQSRSHSSHRATCRTVSTCSMVKIWSRLGSSTKDAVDVVAPTLWRSLINGSSLDSKNIPLANAAVNRHVPIRPFICTTLLNWLQALFRPAGCAAYWQHTVVVAAARDPIHFTLTVRSIGTGSSFQLPMLWPLNIWSRKRSDIRSPTHAASRHQLLFLISTVWQN